MAPDQLPEQRRHGMESTSAKFGVSSNRMESSIAERLERGDVIYYPKCPFSLPEGDDRSFLLEQRLGRGHKNIHYNPHTGVAGGFDRRSPAQAARLRGLLLEFSATATQWLSGILVVIQFMPQTTSVLQCSAALRSNSTVCWPVTMGWPGGRSVCHE